MGQWANEEWPSQHFIQQNGEFSSTLSTKISFQSFQSTLIAWKQFSKHAVDFDLFIYFLAAPFTWFSLASFIWFFLWHHFLDFSCGIIYLNFIGIISDAMPVANFPKISCIFLATLLAIVSAIQTSSDGLLLVNPVGSGIKSLS